jgi:hypothetical protein
VSAGTIAQLHDCIYELQYYTGQVKRALTDSRKQVVKPKPDDVRARLDRRAPRHISHAASLSLMISLSWGTVIARFGSTLLAV